MNFFSALSYVLLWLAPVTGMLILARQIMQFVQLSSYQFGGFLRTVRRRALHSFWPGAAFSLASLILLLIGLLIVQASPVLAFVLSLFVFILLQFLAYLLSLFTYREKAVKVPLVMTARIKRLYAALFLVGAALVCLLYRNGLSFVLSGLIPLLTPLWVLIAMLLVWPLEKGIQMLYRLDARRVLSVYRKSGLEVIGITGSYGKTTVKNLLYAMLSQSQPTLASPASVNTPMGLSRCIREELGPEHRFFIAEMGARHPQDIRVLCRFIRPKYGILTSIGPQHLETMKSIERIASTKTDLIRALPGDGFAVFHNDGKRVSEAWGKTEIDKAIVGNPGDELWAEDVKLSTKGASFTICRNTGERRPVTTRLSGEHNITNILLAAAMALHLGISPDKIAQALTEVAPIASRLQTSIHQKGYTAINNGFNSNPDSSKKALEVLAAHPGRLIVVTPGFIELGRHEASSNRRLGNDIAAVAQIAILIGEKHTRPIKEGLLESGMPEDSIHVFPSLTLANEYISETYGLGDVILYENDLPDHYA